MHMAVPLARADRVAHALGDQHALELREREQDVEDHPAHAVGRIEGLRDRHQRDALAVEDLDQPDEVEQAARQAVDLVDHHDIDIADLDMLHEAGKRGAIKVAASMSAVVVTMGQLDPAAVSLSGNKSRTDLALRNEGVNLALEQMVEDRLR